MLEWRRDAAIAAVSQRVAEFRGVRRLKDNELLVYQKDFVTGWEIPRLCSNHVELKLRILITRNFPFEAPRIAVYPAPPVLSWPHLETHGLLCILNDGASISAARPVSVILEMLTKAVDLIEASLAGNNISDFENEFESYWHRWKLRSEESTLIFRPCQPSRLVAAWHSNNGSVIGEDEQQIRSWIANRIGSDVAKRASIFPVPLLWFREPLRPACYPTILADIREHLIDDQASIDLLNNLLLSGQQRKILLIAFQITTGIATAGVRIVDPSGLMNGFRSIPPKEIFTSRYNKARIVGSNVRRQDHSWIHGRDCNPDSAFLKNKTVIVAGVGAVGSGVTRLLAQAGVGSNLIVDDQILESSNIARHELGSLSIGKPKAVEMARELGARFPHLLFSGVHNRIESFARENFDRLRNADLIICTTGNWATENFLNAIAVEADSFPPVVYGWVEPHAAAGHAIVFFHQDGCLQCLMDELGHLRTPVTVWNDGETTQPIPACGGEFQPYGAVEMSHVQALIAELALDVLAGRAVESSRRVWIGSNRALKRAGGDWHPDWRREFGDPGQGGQIFDLKIEVDPDCLECKAIL